MTHCFGKVGFIDFLDLSLEKSTECPLFGGVLNRDVNFDHNFHRVGNVDQKFYSNQLMLETPLYSDRHHRDDVFIGFMRVA